VKFSIYQLKPAFQRLLMPLVLALQRRAVTPNQVTVFTLLFLCAFSGVLVMNPHQRSLWALFPVLLLLRMALNAIDGMLATVAQQKTPLGALLNEVCDQLADAALYLPFAYVTGIVPELVVLAVVLSGLCEFIGVVALSVGSPRGYAGPMGKSDRALMFSILALLVATAQPVLYSNGLLVLTLLLLLWTLRNRGRAALLNT
jgi:CDP-diacylglycerol---glycerol-3-phosphate 3-phosphatidyltransferase